MKLLLVDDEAFVCERIRRQIDWEKLGIDELVSCSDGLQALNTLRTFQPDILLTDIRMPNLDGIKLAEEFLYQHPEARVIFISGYSDVPYLRSAIRLRAVSYVEKPIDMEELAADIQTAVDELRNLRQAHFDQETLLARGKISRRASIARAVIHVETCREAAALLREECGGIPDAQYGACVTALYRTAESETITEEELSERTADFFRSAETDAFAFLSEDRLGIILVCSGEARTKAAFLTPLFHSLTDFLAEKRIRCAHAVGPFCRNVNRIPASWLAAVKALPRCFYKEPGRLVTAREDPAPALNMEELPLSAYSHALKKENSDMIVSLLENLAGQLRLHDGTLPSDTLRFYYTILMRMYREAEKENVPLFDQPMDEYRMLDLLRSFPFLDQLQAYTLGVVRDYYEKVNNHYTDNPIVNKIIGYLQQNYGDPDLSVTQVSEHLKLSATYVCHLFRNVMGVTLGDYLTRLRMDRAREMLETGRYQVKEVARMVGYRNGNYFSYRYRKETGSAPTDRGPEADREGTR